MTERIPEGVIERLPAYLNILIQLRGDGVTTVSSARLGELTAVNPAQIRRDLTHFGSFGKRGVGYDIATLVERIQRILGADHAHRLALVGAGNLGSAIAGYEGLRQHGFTVTAIFDNDPAKIGARIGEITIQPLEELEETLRRQDIRIGIVAVPSEAAQDVTDRLAAAGVRVILNYTPVIVRVPQGVTLHNTDPVQELLHTLYYLSRREGVAHV
ncbi:MAG: redox-sensing transcriptional repressor Rex [Actinomycetota bacterium]